MDVLGKIKKNWNSENKFNENTIYNRKRYYTSYAVNGFSLSKKISKSNMMSSEILVNIKGEELHPHMEKFSLIARKTRIQNLQNVTKSESWFVLSRSTIIQTLKNPPEKKTKPKPTNHSQNKNQSLNRNLRQKQNQNQSQNQNKAEKRKFGSVDVQKQTR